LSDANEFPKYFRLRKAAEFRKVYQKGEKKTSQTFILFTIPNGLTYSRFGLTTSRKLGKAHDRNRIKRRIREILRTSAARIPKGFDFVVNPNKSVKAREFEELRRELVALLGVGE
jgi:ribonuclease P protein component